MDVFLVLILGKSSIVGKKGKIKINSLFGQHQRYGIIEKYMEIVLSDTL